MHHRTYWGRSQSTEQVPATVAIYVVKVKPNSSLILLSLFYGYSRSSAGYTPLDFAFVVADSKGVVEMLDHDRQLLPREEYPNLEEDIVEVRPYVMCHQG